MNYISAFVTALSNAGIHPKSTKDIRETHTFRRLDAQGSRKRGTISYWLRIEHDYAYGYARDFKTGFELKFRSTMPGLRRADLARIKQQIKIKEAEEALRITDRQNKIAARAKIMLDRAISSGTTPYLVAKKIELLSARILGADIVVPIYEGPELVSWQTIRPDGTKRFPFGGKKKGCWHTIGQIDPTRSIILCEGFATGVSLAKHGCVVVAFDAGNLMPVAKALRKTYRNSHIIVAADNDKSQTGQKSAMAVVSSVPNCSWQMPPDIDTDFNDNPASFLAHGEKPVIGASELSGPARSHADDGDWMSQLTCDAKNQIIPYSIKNAMLYLKNHDNFKGVFVYDDFKQAIILKKCPPYLEEKNFKVRKLNDRDHTMVEASLEDYGLSTSFDKAGRAIEAAARSVTVNSAQEYFGSLEWDGTERLDRFLVDYFMCTEDSSYLSWVGKKWMTAAIKRIFEPGCKFDHILILESQKQGLYKSSALKSLVTFSGENYHTDSVSPLSSDDKYAPLHMIGVMIVELAELTGFSNKDDALIKNWITQTTDRVKLPHDKFVTDYPRQFVFAATTNKTDYLKDPTGNRRYWPVTIGGLIDLKKIDQDREQLWAEAMHLYRAGLYIGPTPEEDKIAEVERQKRLSHDIWTDDVLKIINDNGLDEFRTEDIIGGMKLKNTERNEGVARRVSKILMMNGYVNTPLWNKKLNRTQRMWTKSE